MVQVGCAGILVADTLCGPVEALPRPGQLLAVEDIPSKAGGCAANVAIDLARQQVTRRSRGLRRTRRRRADAARRAARARSRLRGRRRVPSVSRQARR